jgi:hypothetical protein
MFKVMQPKIKNKLNYVKINKSYLDECGFVLIESVLNRGGLIIEKGGGGLLYYTHYKVRKKYELSKITASDTPFLLVLISDIIHP